MMQKNKIDSIVEAYKSMSEMRMPDPPRNPADNVFGVLASLRKNDERQNSHMHPEDPNKNARGHLELDYHHDSEAQDLRAAGKHGLADKHEAAATAHLAAAKTAVNNGDKIDAKLSHHAHQLSAIANGGNKYKHLTMTSRTGYARHHPLVQHARDAHDVAEAKKESMNKVDEVSQELMYRAADKAELNRKKSKGPFGRSDNYAKRNRQSIKFTQGGNYRQYKDGKLVSGEGGLKIGKRKAEIEFNKE